MFTTTQPTRRPWHTMIFASLGATVLAGSARAETVQLYSAFEDSAGRCEDATLRSQHLADKNYDYHGHFSVDGNEDEVNWSGVDDVNGLIRFSTAIGNDSGQVPEGAVIQKAELVLLALDPADPVDLYLVNEDWDSSTVTWDSRGDGMGAWTSVGAQMPSSDATPIGQIVDFPASDDASTWGWVKADITEAVQAWADDPTSNFGLMLDMATVDGAHFVGCDGSLTNYFANLYPNISSVDLMRPGMVVTYDVPLDDVATPKLLWEQSGEDHGDREPVAIATDGSNVFMAGVSYLDNGQTQWVYRQYINRYLGSLRYDESEAILGTPSAIVTDPSMAYVGGCRLSDAGDCDIYIRAYRKTGALDWETPVQIAPFDLAGGDDEVNAMAIYNGDLFVAATTTTEDGDTDYLVLKIDAKTGEVIDFDQSNTPGVDDAALGIQATHNRVVAVGTIGERGQTDAFVKTYAAASFNTAWESSLDLAGDGDEFSSVLVGKSSVVVAGTGTSADGDTDVISMAYRLSDGAAKWTMPMVRDYAGGDDDLAGMTWSAGQEQRFVLASNVEQPLSVNGFVVSGHWTASGNTAWSDETTVSGSVITPYAIAGGRYRAYVAADAFGEGGVSGYMVRAYTAANGNPYWHDRLDADDAFYATVVAADRNTERKVYAAGCRINLDGSCSIIVRAVKGSL